MLKLTLKIIKTKETKQVCSSISDEETWNAPEMTPAVVKELKITGKFRFLDFVENLEQMSIGSKIPSNVFGFVHYSKDLRNFQSKNQTESENLSDLGLFHIINYDLY